MRTLVAVDFTLDSIRSKFEDNCAAFNEAVKDKRVALNRTISLVSSNGAGQHTVWKEQNWVPVSDKYARYSGPIFTYDLYTMLLSRLLLGQLRRPGAPTSLIVLEWGLSRHGSVFAVVRNRREGYILLILTIGSAG